MEAQMIKRIAGISAAVVVTAALIVVSAGFMIGAARAADLSQAVILVASQDLDDSSFAQAVVVAAPLPDGGHIGFIVNRPTKAKLEALFPGQAPARSVKEPVYFGGPVLPRGLFALMRSAPDGTRSAIPLMPGVVAVFDEATIDHVIETTPNAARYFAGLMLWDPDELEQHVADGLWEGRPADADSVLPTKAPGLWNSLRSPMANTDGSPLG